MENPWLTIPLTDYEGHMGSETVGQASMLADEFQILLKRHAPQSVAIIGCAGGNGFDKAANAGVTRLVGIDINEQYIADARCRYADVLPLLELHCADIQAQMPVITPENLVYAALVLEYVELPSALQNLRQMTQPGGWLAVVLQCPNHNMEAVTASPFKSLKSLTSIMRLVPTEELTSQACAEGFECQSHATITLSSGKQFAHLLFQLRG